MFYGWIVVIALWFSYFLAIGPEAFGFGVILGPMARDMGWTMGQASIGFSLYTVIQGVAVPLAALILRKIGNRKTMVIGTFLMGLSGLAFATMTTFWQYLLIAGLLFPVGLALGTVVPVQATITNWFARKRALALSLTLTAGGIGGLAGAPLIHYVVATTGTWRAGWIVGAAGAFLASIIIAVLVRDRPEDMGLLPDGDPDISTAEGLKRHSKVYQTATSWTISEATRTRTFWCLVIAACALILPVQTVLSQSVIYLGTKGIPEAVAAAALGFVAFASTGGRLLAGILGDRFEPRYLLTVALTFLGIGTLILINMKNSSTLYLYVVIFGIGYGATYISIAALLGNYFGKDNFASINGVVWPIQTTIGAIGPVAAAMIFDASGSYTPAFTAIMIFVFIAAVLAFSARVPVHARDTMETSTQAL